MVFKSCSITIIIYIYVRCYRFCIMHSKIWKLEAAYKQCFSMFISQLKQQFEDQNTSSKSITTSYIKVYKITSLRMTQQMYTVWRSCQNSAQGWSTVQQRTWSYTTLSHSLHWMSTARLSNTIEEFLFFIFERVTTSFLCHSNKMWPQCDCNFFFILSNMMDKGFSSGTSRFLYSEVSV